MSDDTPVGVSGNRARDVTGAMTDGERMALARYSMDHASDSVFWIDHDARIVDVNEGACQALGYTRDELVGLTVFDVDPAFPREAWEPHWQTLIAHGAGLVETEHRRKDGTVYPVEVRTNFVEFGGHAFNCAFARDISGRRRIESELKAQRDGLESLVERRSAELKRATYYNRSLIDASIDPLVTIGPDGRITDVNPASEAATGLGRDDLIGTDFSDYFTDPERARAGYRLAFENGWVRDYELVLRHENGGTTPVEYNATVYRDAAGVVIGVFASARDVTARRNAEEALKRLAGELEVIIDAIPGLVFYKDTQNHYLRVNRFVADAHRMTKAQMEGSNLFDLYPRDQAQAYWDDDLEVIRSGKAKLDIDEMWKTEDGVRWINTNKIPHVDASGKVVGVIGVAMDVTARRNAEEAIRRQSWLKTGQTELNDAMRGDQEAGELAATIVATVARYIGAPLGGLYLDDGHGMLALAAGYAHDRDPRSPAAVFASGQGPVGQAAASRRTLRLRDLPAGSVRLVSGLVEIAPVELLYVPLLLGEHVRGVLEIAACQPLDDDVVEFVESIAEGAAVALNSSHLRARQKSLLEEARRMTGELQSQQEELRTANEELEEQARLLRVSEERLQAQQEEMEVTNEELKEKNQLLERQKQEVETARRQIQEKAEEVALASRYKSEFLANMSHELRTPLNSLLLLAQSLAENRPGNLSDDQVESARVIHASGSALLTLINEVLDLAKVESGRMEVRNGKVAVSDIAAVVGREFRHLAREKGLGFEVVVAEDCPADIVTDLHRTEQILRNLVGNAIKFTERGAVTVSLGRGAPGADLFRCGLESGKSLAISVRDTGIGIAPEHQKVVFEAFQQVDGGASRRFGGTGLGLSISRELARLLGGEIQLASEVGKGSTFTLFLPLEPLARPARPASGEFLAAVRRRSESSERRAPLALRATVGPGETAAAHPGIPDDSASIQAADTVILVIEDDPVFARVLYDTCRDRGYKCLAAATGDAGLALARTRQPSGIVLDLRLPGMDGWSVLAALKEDTATRHIPVHIVSSDEATTESLRRGAVGHAMKPIDRKQLDAALGKLQQTAHEKVKRVLLVEDDPLMRANVRKLVGNGDVKLEEAATGLEAIAAIRATRYACVILDLGLPDMDGAGLIARLHDEGLDVPPIIVHTARDLTEREEMDIQEHAQSIVIKDVRSQERLLDEVSLFLHRVVGRMPEQKRQMIRALYETDELLKDKKILLVDDDMRTTFAVSRLLAERGMRPVKAANGQQALKILEDEHDVDLVLMDIMMPVMDGYEAMRRIREQERYRRLPVIALTAKAMPEDRQKCIEAGANDYLPKPLDPERLLSLMRVWLYR